MASVCSMSCAVCAMTDPSELLYDMHLKFYLCGDCEKHWEAFGDDEMVLFPGEAEWCTLMRECELHLISILGTSVYNPEDHDDVFDE